MAVSDPNPDPRDTPGLTPGGSVVAGDTPPAADQDSSVATDRHEVPNQGPASGNRTPMVVALSVIGIVVVAMLVWAVVVLVG